MLFNLRFVYNFTLISAQLIVFCILNTQLFYLTQYVKCRIRALYY